MTCWVPEVDLWHLGVVASVMSHQNLQTSGQRLISEEIWCTAWTRCLDSCHFHGTNTKGGLLESREKQRRERNCRLPLPVGSRAPECIYECLIFVVKAYVSLRCWSQRHSHQWSWREILLHSLPRNWTWVAWMKNRNPSHQTPRGWKLRNKVTLAPSPHSKVRMFQGDKSCKNRYKVYY